MTALEQGSKEWLDMRRKHIGASDASAILGVSPWKTPLQLWRQKMGLEPETPITPAMRRGMELEPIARQAFIAKTGIEVKPAVLFNPDYEWQMASLDGFNQDARCLVEIKCPNAQTHALAKAGKAPEHYLIQVQHQLCVTGLENAFYFSFDGHDGAIVEISRDNTLIAQILDAEKDFWRRMQEFDAPELDKEWQALEYVFLNAYHAKKEAEARYEEVLSLVKAQAGGKSRKGDKVDLSFYEVKGRVQYDKIEALKGIDLEAYRAPATKAMRVTIK